jgi:tetratricopeptide (TPR) repeat protein
MMKPVLILTIFLSVAGSLAGQCPARDFLWNRIIYLRDSSEVPASAQLAELNGYLGQIDQCPYRHDSTHALLLLRVGWLYSLQKDFTKAVEFTNRSIDMIHAYTGSPGINVSHLIKCFNNLQGLYDSTGQNNLKMKAIDSCISIAVKWKTGYRYAVQHIITEIEYNFGRGDFYRCLNYATIGEDISRMAGYRPQDVFSYTGWKINALLFLNKYEEADRESDKAIAACIRSGNKIDLGSLLGMKANIAAGRGETEKAIHYTEQSVSLNKKAGIYSACYGALNNLGFKLYFSTLHQNDQALRCYAEALKYAGSNDSVNTLDNIANVYVQKNDFDSAFYFLRLAFGKIGAGIDESDLLKNSGEEILGKTDAEYLLNLVLDKGSAFLARYRQTHVEPDIRAALRIYRVADRLMDKIRIAQTELSSKLFWRTDTRRLYEYAIESCFLSDNREDAFYFFEKSRAVILNDQLKEQQIGDADLLELAKLRKKILELEREGAGLDPDSKAHSDNQQAIFTTRGELNRVDQLIRERNPWYYQSFLDTGFVTLGELRKNLLAERDMQELLEFFNGDSAVYSLAITGDSCVLKRINKNDFEGAVARYTAYLSDPQRLNRDFSGFSHNSKNLFALLFDKSLLREGRIIISPDGNYFPLEALLTNAGSSRPDYFLNRHVVSYTYSVRFLLNDFKRVAASAGDFLGVAPVHYPSSFQLASLPGSDLSLQQIGSNFIDARSLLGPMATRDHFIRQFAGYQVIQLYTHASESSDRGEPVIYFADSSLYLSDLIPERRPATRLIVLSACETGNGILYKGEGVFSFNRGFAALGIPSCVSNLWSVDDESTYRITELFYQYVAKGLPLDLSLQKAKLDFIATASREKQLPCYWAASIIAGRADAMQVKRSRGWIWTGFIAGLALLCFLGWKYFSARKVKPGWS